MCGSPFGFWCILTGVSHECSNKKEKCLPRGYFLPSQRKLPLWGCWRIQSFLSYIVGNLRSADFSNTISEPLCLVDGWGSLCKADQRKSDFWDGVSLLRVYFCDFPTGILGAEGWMRDFLSYTNSEIVVVNCYGHVFCAMWLGTRLGNTWFSNIFEGPSGIKPGERNQTYKQAFTTEGILVTMAC